MSVVGDRKGLGMALEVGDRVRRIGAPDEKASQRKHLRDHILLGTVVDIRKGGYGVAWDARHGAVFTCAAAYLQKWEG